MFPSDSGLFPFPCPYLNKQSAIRKIKQILLNEVLASEKNSSEKNWINHKKLKRGKPLKIFTGPKFIQIYCPHFQIAWC